MTLEVRKKVENDFYNNLKPLDRGSEAQGSPWRGRGAMSTSAPLAWSLGPGTP